MSLAMQHPPLGREAIDRAFADPQEIPPSWHDEAPDAALIQLPPWRPLQPKTYRKDKGKVLRAAENTTLGGEIDPLYLFACRVDWEQEEDPCAGWELLTAAQSSNDNTRAQALALLASSRHIAACKAEPPPVKRRKRRKVTQETEMKTPYGLEIVENCAECTLTQRGFFCGFSGRARQALNGAGHKSTLPSGAILYVEGQSPRGLFIACSGKVNLSTASRDGKILILKTAKAGDVLGMSSAVSGVPYETTAETATPCHLNFIDRKHFMDLMRSHSEVGANAAQCLSRDYQFAYRDIHDLVLTRSSAGKLARLLLTQSEHPNIQEEKANVTPMTHEEMAQRIGSSRETVTRLLSELRRRQLVRMDGSSLIIEDRTGLEALAV